MTDEEFTDEEKKLLRRYQVLSDSLPGVGKRLAVEVVPPLVFIGLWLYTEHDSFLLALILIQVGCNVYRIVRQYKYVVHLRSISGKVIGKLDGG